MIFAVGIEDTFIAHSREGERPLDEYELTQHYQFWEEDLNKARDIGATMIRYGIPWHKVEVEEGIFDWEFTDKVMQWFVDNPELEPIIDFVHYGLPLWIEDSFLNPNYPKYVKKFVIKFTERYDYKYFTATNEPFVNLHYCCVRSEWPPYTKDKKSYYQVLKNLAVGMVEIARTIKEVDDTKINIHVDACTIYDHDNSLNDTDTNYLQSKAYIFWDILTCNLTGEVYDEVEENLGIEFIEWFKENKYMFDYSGINYYPQMSVLINRNGSDESINGDVEGLIEVCNLVHKKYKRPLYITETSYIGTAYEKIKWIETIISANNNDDIDVVGFTYFPFIDLVDWAYKYSGKNIEEEIIKFGLFDLEYKDGVMYRVENEAAGYYKAQSKASKKIKLEVYLEE